MMLLLGLAAAGAAAFLLAHHYSQKMLDWFQFQSIGTRDYIFKRLSQMYIEVPPERILMGQVGLSFVSASIAFLLFLPNVLAGLGIGVVAAAIAWKLPKPVVDEIYRRRVKKFNLQMVDGLALMSNGMKSGLSIVQALDLAASQMPQPMKQELELVLNQNKVGVPLEEAFENLAQRINSDEVDMFVTSINILKETGGNLAETFDTISFVIRERIKAEAKIEAMTQQARINGMTIIATPPLLGVMIYTQDPSVMMPLFTTFYGWIMLGVVITLLAGGYFLIKRITTIEV